MAEAVRLQGLTVTEMEDWREKFQERGGVSSQCDPASFLHRMIERAKELAARAAGHRPSHQSRLVP